MQNKFGGGRGRESYNYFVGQNLSGRLAGRSAQAHCVAFHTKVLYQAFLTKKTTL